MNTSSISNAITRLITIIIDRILRLLKELIAAALKFNKGSVLQQEFFCYSGGCNSTQSTHFWMLNVAFVVFLFDVIMLSFSPSHACISLYFVSVPLVSVKSGDVTLHWTVVKDTIAAKCMRWNYIETQQSEWNEINKTMIT